MFLMYVRWLPFILTPTFYAYSGDNRRVTWGGYHRREISFLNSGDNRFAFLPLCGDHRRASSSLKSGDTAV